jgi:hypothetical protein
MGYDISSGMGLGFRVSVVQLVDTKEQDHTQMEDGAGGAMVAEEAPGALGGDDFAPFVVASTQSHRMVARLDRSSSHLHHHRSGFLAKDEFSPQILKKPLSLSLSLCLCYKGRFGVCCIL